MSEGAQAFAERIRAAGAGKAPLRIRGGGSKDFYGTPGAGELLDASGHRGIVAYEPTELYVTARCGTPLLELEQALAGNGQMLGFEPPHFGGGATVGGMLSAGLSGPRRVQAGALREHVLGVEIVDGQGQVLRFGGRVLKNVAGYDVSRLMAGSLGTLALVTEATLKVLPRPAAEITLGFERVQQRALERMNEWAGQPLPISASAWHAGQLWLRLSGAEPGVQAARRKLGGDALDADAAAVFWPSLRDQAHAFFAAPLWRLALPSTAPALDLPGEQFIEWGGALRWLRSAADAVAIRNAATRAGGHATLFRAAGVRGAEVFHPLPGPLLALHRRVKQVFDPLGVFPSLYPSTAHSMLRLGSGPAIPGLAFAASRLTLPQGERE